MPLGLGASLSRAGIVTPGIITDGLAMKHMYPAGAVQPLSDGAVDINADAANNEYIDVGTIAITTNDVSMGCWVYVTEFGANADNACYIENRDASGTNVGISLRNDGTNSKFEALLDYGGSVFQATTGTVNTHQWYHILTTIDRDGNMVLYVNGVANATTDISTQSSVNLTHSATAKIGQKIGGGEIMGYVCNAGYWDRVLTQAEIKSIMFKQYADLTTSEKTSLVSFWNLDNNLTTQGSSSWVADEADTTFGSNVTPTWTSSNGAVIDGQTITLGSSGVVSASATISPVGVYKVNVTVTGYTGSGTIEMPWDGGGNSNMRVSANGTYEFYEASGDTSWAVYAPDGVGGTITINSITKANGNIGELK